MFIIETKLDSQICTDAFFVPRFLRANHLVMAKHLWVLLQAQFLFPVLWVCRDVVVKICKPVQKVAESQRFECESYKRNIPTPPQRAA